MTESVLTLAHDLVEMSRLVEDDDVEAITERFLDRLVRTVPNCDHAMITVEARDGRAETIAAKQGSPETALAVDLTGDNPIGEALRFGEPRRIGDADTETRWIAFTGALSVHGFRSCLVLPVPTKHSPPAVLTLASRTPHHFDGHAYDIVLLLTLHAGVAFDNVRVYHDSRTLVDNLTTALQNRHTIGQAQGVLMHRFGIDAETGFAVLKRASQHANVKLRDLARTIVTAQEDGELSEALAKHGIIGPNA